MADRKYSPLKGKVLRVVRLDECGAPVTGAEGLVVSDGFIQVQFSPQYKDGEEFLVTNANGDLVVNETDPARLKRIDVTIQMAEIDPAAFEIMLGVDPMTADGDIVGMLLGEQPNETKFGLEVWGGVAGQACVGGAASYEHLDLGILENAKFGDSTTMYGPTDLTITASTHKAPNHGNGHFGLLPTPYGPFDHMARYVTQVAPPEVETGYQAFTVVP